MQKTTLMNTKLFYKIRIILFCTSIFLSQNIFSQHIIVKNSTNKTLIDYTVEISVEKLKSLKVGEYVVVAPNGEILPMEIVSNLAGEQKAIFPVAKLFPNTTNIFQIQQGLATGYPKRTYAEIAHKIGGHFEGKNYEGGFSWIKTNYLRKPDEYTDHSYFIKYEGPGWESDKVAFRFYLDWRNGIDVFAKKTPGIVLPFVGVDDYEKYHHMADWGMDNMKVGKTLGLGSIAVWDGKKAVRVEKTDSIVAHVQTDGKIRSQIATTYYGWETDNTKCNLKSLISIDAGQRVSHMELFADKEINNIATGIMKDKNGELILPERSVREWSYIATFGKQSLNSDFQGLAVFYRTRQLQQITEDDLNHIIVLNTDNGFVEYYFMATWELDWQPISDKKLFINCVNETLDRLNNPAEIRFSKK